MHLVSGKEEIMSSAKFLVSYIHGYFSVATDGLAHGDCFDARGTFHPLVIEEQQSTVFSMMCQFGFEIGIMITNFTMLMPNLPDQLF